MDQEKIGALIRSLRIQHALTQRELASMLAVSDKAVSKWERGFGCPDVSLLPALSRTFGVELEQLLSGDLDANEIVEGNMKKLQIHVCPDCRNLISATGEAGVYCCGKKLTALQAQKAQGANRLLVERVENDYFITCAHPMTKEHHVSFVALLTGESMILRKLYPEWDLQTRIPCIGHGALLWYCTQHGLFQQLV